MLSLYNSLTRKIEKFEPLKKGEVRIFTCGPSTYQRPHIGNYRTFLFEDVLQRYLEYTGYKVIRTLNFTDVEEKSITEAEKRDLDVMELTKGISNGFFGDLELLNIKEPEHNPRSSTSVDQAVELIQELLKKGNAYWHNGNVYFDLKSFKDFGKLGHLDRSRFPKKRRRYHRDTYPGNRWNVGDFILWHGYRQGDTTYWDTELGKGRPAWNVQDPAMLVKTLGPCVDICCGGEDNLVRHHDYTIAVTESYSDRELAHYWLHGAHLLVDGKKMSKSKGNVIYLDDLVKAGYTGEQIRFFMIYSSYRQRLNFTYENLKITSGKLGKLKSVIKSFSRAKGAEESDEVQKLIQIIEKDFQKNMDNDLDVRNTFDTLMESILKLEEFNQENRVTKEDSKHLIKTLTEIDSVLRVLELSKT